jgi:serine/threonine-protein kinase
MAIAAGTKIGPYDVVGLIGAGGMGEVYCARDTKLDREVALKVLPDHLIDQERLARFAREAQVVASLSHPNIAAIHGLEHLEGRPVLVLELVEGPTLADRLAQGPVTQDEAVSVARQIAEALEAAHEQGVVHRDLKPANVKLRPDGLVKVLDFGLAKLAGPPEANPATAGLHGDGGVRLQPDMTMSPTMTSPAMTGIGLILGTAAYMSPEQAAGKPADKRADIWSFGVVLWEMLTGGRLFADGESTSHVLADVLRAPIEFDKIPAGPLRELLRRCLDRNVKTRLRDIGEARVILSRPIEPAVVMRDVAAPRRSVVVPWALAALLAVATGVAFWAPWRAEPERRPVHLDVDLGPNVALMPASLTRDVIFSPDGSRLMYIASVTDGPLRLYIWHLQDDASKAAALPGTDGVTAAAFSPDGRNVAFIAGTRVFRVSADGGAPQRLADLASASNQITWGEGDVILASGIRSPLMRIPATGGNPVPLTALEGAEIIHAAPRVLPGGKAVLFLAGAPSDVTPIYAVPVTGGARKMVVPNGGSPHYIPTGHLLYLVRDTLFAIRFNPDTLDTAGDPVPIVDDVRTSYSGLVAVGSFSVAANGTLVYRRATGEIGNAPRSAPSVVEWIDTAGKRTPFVSTPGAYMNLRLSADGHQVAMTVLGQKGVDVAVFDSRSDNAPRNVTFDGASADPGWIQKSGTYIVYGAAAFAEGTARSGRPGMRWVRTDGGDSQPLLPDVRPTTIGSFNAATSRSAYSALETATGQAAPVRSIFTVSVAEENGRLKFGSPERFSPPQYNEVWPQFSPDGRWIAFVTNRNGRDEVWVRAVTAPAGGVRFERQLSSDGGADPRWASNSELLYQAGDQILALPLLIKGDTLEPGRPRVRVDKVGSIEWDVAPDGRIAVIAPVNAADSKAAPAEHTVVFRQNFFDEVRQRVK